MRFSILGALLGTVALAGAGGVAITQTSAADSLRFTDNPSNARMALAGDPSTSPPATSPTPTPTPTGTSTETPAPTPTAQPTDAEYTAKTRVVKRRGVSYLNVSIAYEGAAFFNVEQRVCKRRSCKTADVDLMVFDGSGDARVRLGYGTYKKRGQPGVSMAPLPTVTVRETVTVTEPGPTVTVTEPGPTVTETFTCQPYVEPTGTPLPPEEPTVTPSPDGSVTPSGTPSPTVTPSPSDTATPAPSGTVPTVPSQTPTTTPTDGLPPEEPTESPTESPTGIPTCPPPSEPPVEPPTEPTEPPAESPTATGTPTATPSESATTPTGR
ncbi:hypothetical protein [Nonomuraea candida]|uniref:hypothetical protein n=1 Tax=Nonomuraea candida TaxID=359159 RepID=UPI0005BBC996|nr:hypothetical protein [Nonomuraea candida]